MVGRDIDIHAEQSTPSIVIKGVSNYNYTFTLYTFKKYTFKSVIFKSSHKLFFFTFLSLLRKFFIFTLLTFTLSKTTLLKVQL